MFYYEIKITRLEKSENSAINPEIGVGLSEEHVSLDQMVGWQHGSWGYHGDNGKIYDQQGTGEKLHEGYGSRHTVGCGIDFSKKVGFLTKNGRYLGKMTPVSAIFVDLQISISPIVTNSILSQAISQVKLQESSIQLCPLAETL